MKRLLLLSLIVLFPVSASALPSSTTATGEDGDVSATLTMTDQAVLGDINVRCELEFHAGGDGTPWVDGDSVQLRVYEDDAVFGDDLLWQEVIELTPAQVEAQEISGGFDCSFPLPNDGVFNANGEYYVEVTAVKDETCFLCSYDRARTAQITVLNLEDDDFEENDDLESAHTLDAEILEVIAADPDWYEVEVAEVSSLVLTARYRATAGELDIAIFDTEDNSLGSVEVQELGAEIAIPDLEPGTYYVRIAPQTENDHAFYDIGVSVSALDVECVPDDEEVAACGRCGQRTRVCGQDRRWTPFGPCEGQGECSPGDGRVNVCGNCGTVSERCGADCVWEPAGECMGEGECPRGESEARECDGGSEVRACDNACQWREWGPCQGDECESGTVRACYDGPEGTATIGVCTSGRQVCNLGRWGECEGEVLPSAEVCHDNRDNDCDGDTDVADSDCGLDQSALGDPCEASLQCAGDLVCVGPPEHDQFVGGYCGDDACTGDADCDGGVCAEAFGGRFCLATCSRDPDCRGGYLCVEVEPGVAGCLPRCTLDSHCGGDNPFCDEDSGLCVAEDDGANNGDVNNGTNNGVSENNGAEPPPPSSGKKKDGCAAVGVTSWFPSLRRR